MAVTWSSDHSAIYCNQLGGQIGPAGSGVEWSARAHRQTRCPREGGASTVGAATTHLTRWQRWGSPERWVDGEGGEGRWLVDVPRQQRGPMDGEGGDKVLRLEEEMGEVHAGKKRW
jgi:hypothetical protein